MWISLCLSSWGLFYFLLGCVDECVSSTLVSLRYSDIFSGTSSHFSLTPIACMFSDLRIVVVNDTVQFYSCIVTMKVPGLPFKFLRRCLALLPKLECSSTITPYYSSDQGSNDPPTSTL